MRISRIIGILVLLFAIIVALAIALKNLASQPQEVRDKEEEAELDDILGEVEASLTDEKPKENLERKPPDSLEDMPVAPEWIAQKQAAKVREIRERAIMARLGTLDIVEEEIITDSMVLAVTESGSTYFNPYEISVNHEDPEVQEELENQQAQWIETVWEIESWIDYDISEYEYVIKAQSLRNQAMDIRSRAKFLGDEFSDSEIVSRTMNRRADMMEQVARKLDSAPRSQDDLIKIVDDFQSWEMSDVTADE